MAKQKYALNPEEKIIYKVSSVRHGFWGAYTNTLVITNQAVILENYGLLNNFKGIDRYDYSSITQAIAGEATNGEKQLELYINNKVEDFSPGSNDEKEIELLVQIINELIGPNAEYYDYDYYVDLINEIKNVERLCELREKSENSSFGSCVGIAKNILKSGDLSIGGIAKGISKGSTKNNFLDGIMDDMGIYDIQDEFTEIGNDFREMFGFKPKMTHADQKELERLEKEQHLNQIKKEKQLMIKEKMLLHKKDSLEHDDKMVNEKKSESSLESINDQFEMLKKAKELLDAGILSADEFEQKKKEIMKL